jgi:hypothetical protein
VRRADLFWRGHESALHGAILWIYNCREGDDEKASDITFEKAILEHIPRNSLYFI